MTGWDQKYDLEGLDMPTSPSRHLTPTVIDRHLELISAAAADVLIAAGMISARPRNEAELLMFLDEFAAHLRSEKQPVT